MIMESKLRAAEYRHDGARPNQAAAGGAEAGRVSTARQTHLSRSGHYTSRNSNSHRSAGCLIHNILRCTVKPTAGCTPKSSTLAFMGTKKIMKFLLLPRGWRQLCNSPYYVYVELRSSLILSRQRSEGSDGVPRFVEDLEKIMGAKLIGCVLEAPLTSHERLYVLPLFTIKEDFGMRVPLCLCDGKRTLGTGVVTSVPSDSPYDYTALKDLRKNTALREKYGITDEMMSLSCTPIPIIATPSSRRSY